MQNDLTEKEVLEILHQNDNARNWEFPGGFTFEQPRDKARAFHAELEERTSSQLLFETDSLIQDASFHSEIDLGNDNWLRFSNFGNLISVYADETVNQEMLSAIKLLAKERGYIYIPGKYTPLPYDGENAGVTGINDWWSRYFNWV